MFSKLTFSFLRNPITFYIIFKNIKNTFKLLKFIYHHPLKHLIPSNLFHDFIDIYIYIYRTIESRKAQVKGVQNKERKINKKI